MFRYCVSARNCAIGNCSQDFAVIETGGEDHDHQFDQIRFLMRELQRFNVE